VSNNNKVSIVLNCYNSEKYIKQCLDSILAQTYVNFEIILVDNCSIDSTKFIVKKYKDKRIKYFYLKTHCKLGAARNFALSKCSGDFIAFIDSDDLWHKDKLLNQIPCFDDESIGLVFSNSYKFKDNGWKQKIYSKIPPDGSIFEILFTNYFISLETVVIRKKVLTKLQRLFCEDFQIIEEYDLICRLGLITKLFYVDKILAYWRFREDSYTWKNRHLIYKERDQMLKMFKKEFNDFENSYPNQIIQFEKRTHLEEIFYLIQQGKNGIARIKLKKYLFKDYKWTILYFILFNKNLTKIILRKLGYIY